MEAVLPVRKPPTGAATPGQLPAVPEAVQKALKDAAETARTQGAGPAAQKLDEFAQKPENQTPEVYAFLGTLYLKLGDRDKAEQAFSQATKLLQFPTPGTPGETGTPPAAPRSPGGGGTGGQ
jgi:hypothetical protein